MNNINTAKSAPQSDATERAYYRKYDLAEVRAQSLPKEPAAHQHGALTDLHAWYDSTPRPDAGGMLVMPTGGGKTFTAVRLACQRLITDGYKVLWVAPSYDLVNHAFDDFGEDAGMISGEKRTLAVRCVSGASGHYSASNIETDDDVVIGTIQTLHNARKAKDASFAAFIASAKGKLLVVQDEAHHIPAISYRSLVCSLRKDCGQMHLLGLTATPTHMDTSKRGWFGKLFPQGILHQVSFQQLLAAKILARPICEEPCTDFVPDFDGRQWDEWEETGKDLPKEIITQLAENRERNVFIAQYYADNQAKYGKTIIFADRWFQCEQIAFNLRARGVRAGTMYSQVDAGAATSDAPKRDKGENAKVLTQFRASELEVVICVRMLTEGADILDVQTVFLTRATKSHILLTQMVGRALRGPAFGGTENAYIVSFIDNWKPLINWAKYDEFQEDEAEDDIVKRRKRQAVEQISIEMVRQLARQMHSGVNVNPGPYASMLPVGWYRVECQADVQGGDTTEAVRELILVFQAELDSYRTFIKALEDQRPSVFAGGDVTIDACRETVVGWLAKHFTNAQDHIGTSLASDLCKIARHVAQNGTAPQFLEFEERNQHNLDQIADMFIQRDLGARATEEALRQEYGRADRLWSMIYPSYDSFKHHFDGAVNRLLRDTWRGAHSATTVWTAPTPTARWDKSVRAPTKLIGPPPGPQGFSPGASASNS